LIWYLLDELYALEKDHSDAMNPANYLVNTNQLTTMRHSSGNSEHRPMTLAEGCQLMDEVVTRFTQVMVENIQTHLRNMEYTQNLLSHSTAPVPHDTVTKWQTPLSSTAIAPPFNFQVRPTTAQPVYSGPEPYIPPHNVTLHQLGHFIYPRIIAPLPGPPPPYPPSITTSRQANTRKVSNAKSWYQWALDWTEKDEKRGLFKLLSEWTEEEVALGRQATKYTQQHCVSEAYLR
jgi:hypothetical protein